MNRPLATIGLSALPILAALSAAHADESNRWYGWQIMLADATLVAVAVATQVPAVVYLAPFDGVLVHVGNEEPVKALASVGIRSAGMFGGFLAGYAYRHATQGPCSEECYFEPLMAGIFGGALGLGVAAVIDWTALARKEAPPPERPPAVRSVGFTPRTGGGVLAVSGSF